LWVLIVCPKTWVWLDDTQTGPITNGTYIEADDYACVTVTATSVDIAVDPGDGSDVLVCEGPGRVYDFDADWVDQRGGSLGFIARATAPITLEILDLQAVAVAN